MLSKEKVTRQLREVIDPEIGVNIVDLGLIYGIYVRGKIVRIKMTLTTPGCPLGKWFEDQVKGAVRSLPEVKEVEVEIVFSPPWTKEMIKGEVREELGIK